MNLSFLPTFSSGPILLTSSALTMPVLTSSLNNKWFWWVQRITIKQFSLQFSFKTFTMTLKPRNITFENQKLLQNVLFSGIWSGQVGLGSMRWDTGTTDHAMKSIMDFKHFCGCLNRGQFWYTKMLWNQLYHLTKMN